MAPRGVTLMRLTAAAAIAVTAAALLPLFPLPLTYGIICHPLLFSSAVQPMPTSPGHPGAASKTETERGDVRSQRVQPLGGGSSGGGAKNCPR